MHPDAKELFAIDENLRKEADEILARSGIGPILAEAGFKPVGSYVMHTMTWRDLDFEREDEPDWEKHWELGTQLSKAGWCVRLQCIDARREGWKEEGLYWGLRVANPSSQEKASPDSPTVWKLDLWTVRPEAYASAINQHRKWTSLLTEEGRAEILAIKQAVWNTSEYRWRGTLKSIHIYQAVLEEDVRGVEAFMEWWRGKYQQEG